MRDVIITGANRGIGLEFTYQCLERGDRVIATFRTEETVSEIDPFSREIRVQKETTRLSLALLRELYPKTLTLYQLDVRDWPGIQRFAQTVDKVDWFISNAGTKGCVPGEPLADIDDAGWIEATDVNEHAPRRFAQVFYPKLSERENALFIYISSGVSSTARNQTGRYFTYRPPKAAGNSMTATLSIQLMLDWKKNHSDRLGTTPCAVAICPKHVRTRMGGESAPLSAEESVLGMMNIAEYVERTKKSNGLYLCDTYNPYEVYDEPPILTEVLAALQQEESSQSPVAASQ